MYMPTQKHNLQCHSKLFPKYGQTLPEWNFMVEKKKRFPYFYKLIYGTSLRQTHGIRPARQPERMTIP